jgi:hypothetical protein
MSHNNPSSLDCSNNNIYVVRPLRGGWLDRNPPVATGVVPCGPPQIFETLQHCLNNNHVNESHSIWTLPIRCLHPSPPKPWPGLLPFQFALSQYRRIPIPVPGFWEEAKRKIIIHFFGLAPAGSSLHRTTPVGPRIGAAQSRTPCE